MKKIYAFISASTLIIPAISATTPLAPMEPSGIAMSEMRATSRADIPAPVAGNYLWAYATQDDAGNLTSFTNTDPVTVAYTDNGYTVTFPIDNCTPVAVPLRVINNGGNRFYAIAPRSVVATGFKATLPGVGQFETNLRAVVGPVVTRATESLAIGMHGISDTSDILFNTTFEGNLQHIGYNWSDVPDAQTCIAFVYDIPGQSNPGLYGYYFMNGIYIPNGTYAGTIDGGEDGEDQPYEGEMFGYTYPNPTYGRIIAVRALCGNSFTGDFYLTCDEAAGTINGLLSMGGYLNGMELLYGGDDDPQAGMTGTYTVDDDGKYTVTIDRFALWAGANGLGIPVATYKDTVIRFAPYKEGAIETLETGTADADTPAEYYTLQGQRVSRPQPGSIVIERRGSCVSKKLIR